MQLSEMACKILEFFRDTYREPSARISMATLDTHFGMGPAVAALGVFDRAKSRLYAR